MELGIVIMLLWRGAVLKRKAAEPEQS